MSFSVRNRAAMFEKPGRVDTEAEVPTSPAPKVVPSPVSPTKSTASFVSSMSYKSQNSVTSPIGSGPYKSFRNKRGEGSPRTKSRSSTPNRSSTSQRSASEQGSTTPKRASTPQRSSTSQRSPSPLKSPTQQRSASPSPRGSEVSTRVSSPQKSTVQRRSASPSPRGSTVSTRVSSPQKSTSQRRSASPSPRGTTVSTRVSSPQKSTAQGRSASPSPRGTTASTRVLSPPRKKSLSPRKMSQTKPAGKIVSPFLSTDDVASKPVVFPMKSPTKPRGWATDKLKSSGLVSQSPFRNASSSHSRDATETRDTSTSSHSWSKKNVSVEKRDSAAKREDPLLKTSLDAASVVMEEEKSQAGSSNASSRSSLSAKELGDVAKRALDIANRKTQNSKPVQTTAQTSSQGSKLSVTPSFLNNSSSQRSASPYRGRNTTPSISTKEDDNKSSASASWGANLKPISPAKAASPRTTASPSATWLSKTASASPSKGSQVAPPSPKASPAKSWQVKTVQPSSPRFTPKSSPKNFVQPSSPRRHTPVSSPKADVKSASPAISAAPTTASGRVKSRAAAVAAARKNRTAAKSTNSAEARRAILASTMQKKGKKGEISKLSDNAADVEVSARLGMKASRVLAMKNSQTKSDHNRDEIGSSVSVESSSRSRRVDHPAFAARGHAKNNNDAEKPFSAELMSSFRHFSAARPDTDKTQQPKPNVAKVDSFGFPEQEESMHSTNIGFTPRNEDNIYLNNFSMMSSMHEQMTPSNTGMRTTRSNHSMAQSMISTTPTGHRKANGEFDYMLKTPTVSQRSTLEATEGNAANDSKSVHSVATGKITNSPPGFVLKDGGEKLVVGASEAANANDEFIDQFFNDHDAEAPSPKGSTAGTDVSEPLAMEALNLPEDSHGEEGEDAKDNSTSKRSANTSIRTGLSSIQNDLTQDNGSKSMRSGLSGIFPENNSQHKPTNQTKPLPDTIREEEEREVLSAMASQAGTQAPEGERDTLFDGASFQSKALKDGQNDTLFEGVSHASSQKSGGWWKGKKSQDFSEECPIKEVASKRLPSGRRYLR
mmetsp:Transcript_23617/g.57910  ORF Transcript_23617/g.57910 Transcript_23617/m.57910 type:complete len:1056 (+) Transcript_23617:34-3201(+)